MIMAYQRHSWLELLWCDPEQIPKGCSVAGLAIIVIAALVVMKVTGKAPRWLFNWRGDDKEAFIR